MSKFSWAIFENLWDLLLTECDKRREKETSIPLTKLLRKRILSNKQSISSDIISVSMLDFEKQGIGWNLSMMRISYKLTKRTTKSEKLKNFRKLCNIMNLMTIRYIQVQKTSCIK